MADASGRGQIINHSPGCRGCVNKHSKGAGGFVSYSHFKIAEDFNFSYSSVALYQPRPGNDGNDTNCSYACYESHGDS
jgi:hypothetical protein